MENKLLGRGVKQNVPNKTRLNKVKFLQAANTWRKTME